MRRKAKRDRTAIDPVTFATVHSTEVVKLGLSSTCANVHSSDVVELGLSSTSVGAALGLRLGLWLGSWL